MLLEKTYQDIKRNKFWNEKKFDCLISVNQRTKKLLTQNQKRKTQLIELKPRKSNLQKKMKMKIQQMTRL